MLHLKYTREKFNFEISIPRQFLSIEKYGPFISFQLSWNVSQPNQRDRSLFCNFLFEFKTISPLDGSIWTYFGRFYTSRAEILPEIRRPRPWMSLRRVVRRTARRRLSRGRLDKAITHFNVKLPGLGIGFISMRPLIKSFWWKIEIFWSF